jgi:type I restriction enzyme S subunit
MSKEKLIPELRFPEFVNEGEWEEKTLEDVADSESSSLALNKIEDKENGCPVYGADSIVGYIDEFQQKEKYISIVKDGSGVGRLNLCKPKSSILGTLACIKSKDLKKFNLEWIYYQMNTIDFTTYKKGSGIPHIYFSDFKKEPTAVPKPQEQQKIASCLSSLDDLLAAHSQKLELLKDHKKGLMQNLFPQEGETVPKYRFKEFEKDGEWVEKPLVDICKLVRGPFGGALKKEIFVKEGYAVYEQSHAIYSDFSSFRYYIDEAKFNELKRFSVKTGDLIMSCSGTMGKFAIIPDNNEAGVINQALLKLTVKKGFDKFFVKMTLEADNNQEKLLSQSAGGAIKNVVSVSQIKELPLMIPSLQEQQKIASCLSSLDTLITAQVENIVQLQLHKKGLMQGLFPKINDR